MEAPEPKLCESPPPTFITTTIAKPWITTSLCLNSRAKLNSSRVFASFVCHLEAPCRKRDAVAPLQATDTWERVS